MSTNVNELVDTYRKLRDKKAELKRVYEANVKKFDRAMQDIESQLLQLMQETGVKTLKTDAGTAYISQKVNYNIADYDEFSKFILQSGHLEMLQRRPAKSAVDEYVAATDQLPPGLNRHAELVVNIRKS